MTPSAREQVTGHVRAVEGAIERARSKWHGLGVSFASWAGIGAADQVLGAIASIEKTVQTSWKTRGLALADSAKPDAAKLATWVKDGNDILANLASTAQDARTNNLGAIMLDTATATAKDAATGAVSAVKFFGRFGLPAVLAVLVLALVWRFRAVFSKGGA